jgi:hypothetical protein
MTDFFSWSIPLGRWAGTRVRAHIVLVLFAVIALLETGVTKDARVSETAAWLLLLMVSLALHELAHALAAAYLEFENEEAKLWPLGDYVGPSMTLASRSRDALYVAAAGIVATGMLAIVSGVILYFCGAQMVLNPFGNGGTGVGAPTLLRDGKTLAAPFTALWWLGWFGYINWVLFLANAIIPALPMDMGRIVRCYFDSVTKDNLAPTMCARGSMIVLGLGGLIRIVGGTYGGLHLIMLGVVIYLLSRQEARLQEEGEFFDDGVFGYDFSQGYTSLEASAATVRPRREGALKRWRRQRSEERRRRREAQEAAEEQRMDEILVKLHTQGRAALSDEEQRFLVRVSAKYKNRSKSRD